MKENYKSIIFLFLIIALASLGYFLKRDDNSMKKEEIDGGIVKDNRLPGYSEKINSKKIIKFEYNGEYKFFCELESNGLHIKSTGGSSYDRDGSYFKLDYYTSDSNLLNELQEIIEKYNISKNNGYEHETAGLPAGLGDSISVLYDSGEKIWKYSNQSPTISEKATKAIYAAFKKYAKMNNLDFTSDGSNVLLYDDATKEFLQGKWKGDHFGREYIVIFNDDIVQVFEDGNIIDEIKYIIIDGHIVVDKLKDGLTKGKDYHDYEEFSVISMMSKKMIPH